MAVFKRNLTSKILEEQSAKVIAKKDYPISILEVGCGNGNISLNLAKQYPEHSFFASDISTDPFQRQEKLTVIL